MRAFCAACMELGAPCLEHMPPKVSRAEKYINALMARPDAKAVSERAMRDILVFGSVQPKTHEMRKDLMEQLNAEWAEQVEP